MWAGGLQCLIRHPSPGVHPPRQAPEPPEPPSDHEDSLPKKRKLTNACVACKNAKEKCSGEQPCTACVRKARDCVFNPEDDQRRRIPLRRRIDELEEEQRLFLRILRTLRHRSHVVDGLLDYIKKEKPDLATIRRYMDQHLPPHEFRKTPELLRIYQDVERFQDPIPKRGNQALNIAQLCDYPPFLGMARPWTTLTDDNGFVSHLISLFFTWQQAFCNWIDQDLFFRDMNAGNVNCTFCSPILVNAILAVACLYSDYPEAWAEPGNTDSLGQHFFTEAERLIDAEEGKITFATAQGIAVLYTCLSAMGKDRQGWTYLSRAVHAVEYLRSTSDELFRTADVPRDVMAGALDYLEIGLFGATVACTLCLQKEPIMKPPKGLQLPIHQGDDGTWSPYPRQMDPVPAAHRHCALNYRARLAEIATDVCEALFSNGRKPPRPDLEEVVTRAYSQLTIWMHDLPGCLHCDDHSVPEILSLHQYYHSIIMVSFAFLRTRAPQDDETTEKSIESAREKCISSAHIVSDLVNIHRNQWGIERVALFDIQFISVALYNLLDDLRDEKSHAAFRNLAKAMMVHIPRWKMARGMFRLIQIAMTQLRAYQPPDIVEIFRTFEQGFWRPEDWNSFSSAYPNFSIAIRQDKGASEEVDMDRILAHWDGLTLTSDTGSELSGG
ncbi:hypothetical protein BO70DRAFT_395068 [Aspergillus heteromorphus CBS 117.55]|uniref:Zn(2)-C6 fungal-type domain-containing protein n=1 Tax=Aspergillus heteromorphus CBS 117.55 TaxID=1448321 RepID=A0A317WHL2_9EURO|nr:uncharacterized protein BO70DRAFT_395068 [Aspergillus heteromorphus CBS 117.55]PWY85936.1 hypothetical protein BO70DRAFT_395068 [Aspergillus heteromorphus CBS 117.55]